MRWIYYHLSIERWKVWKEIPQPWFPLHCVHQNSPPKPYMARFRIRHSYYLTFTCLAELKSVTLQGRWMDGRSLITLRGWWPSSGDDKLAPWRPQQTGGGAQESEHIWFLMTAIFPILRNIVLSNSDQQKFWFGEWRELPTREIFAQKQIPNWCLLFWGLHPLWSSQIDFQQDWDSSILRFSQIEIDPPWRIPIAGWTSFGIDFNLVRTSFWEFVILVSCNC